MTLFLSGMALLVVSALAALLTRRFPKACTLLGAGGAVAGCALALLPAARGLCGAAVSIRYPWSLPGGTFYAEIDSLSAFFLIPALGLPLVSAIYGGKYMMAYAGKKSLGASWFFYNLLAAGMAMSIVARNAVLFLMAWETMALASFFLVTFENEKPEAREAGWIYLVATHIGTAFLLVFFLLPGGESLDFDRFNPGAHPGLLFLLALVGFGTKAGFMPLHVWLPEAHPAAPSHVSAVMSGAMIKTGIYGLLRALMLLGQPPAWWGWVLVVIGISSGVLGVLFALAQHDLKRLLAYHSVENIGIIALGLGAGLLGVSYHSPVLAVLGFGGGLLHVLNHALFKGLLFLGAGSVAHGTGTREIDRLGGLLKRMPWTGITFLVGAAAISGLPPLNGFISEFLIYLGAFGAIQGTPAESILGITLIGIPGPDRRPGRGLLYQGVRRRLPGRAPHSRCRESPRGGLVDAPAHGYPGSCLPGNRPYGLGFPGVPGPCHRPVIGLSRRRNSRPPRLHIVLAIPHRGDGGLPHRPYPRPGLDEKSPPARA